MASSDAILAEQIIAKLREAQLNGGTSNVQVYEKMVISEQPFHWWGNQYDGGDMKADEAKWFKELEEENRRLKTAVADLTLDKQILKEALDGLGNA